MKYSVLLLLSLWAMPSWSQSWSLAKDKDGIKIYTRKIEGWGIKEFKGVITFQAPFKDVVNAIKDVAKHDQWQHDTKNTKLLKSVGDNEIYGYSVVDAPWPVADRDNVTQYKIRQESPKVICIDMQAAAGIHPEVSGNVRVKRMKGQWRVEDKGNGLVEVTQQAVAEPGGSIPDWLANSSVIDAPFGTLKGLKFYLTNPLKMYRN
jgi:hypothetical protein